MSSRAEQYRRREIEAQQRAAQATDTNIRLAFEDVAKEAWPTCQEWTLTNFHLRTIDAIFALIFRSALTRVRSLVSAAQVTRPRVASEMALHVLAYNLTRVMNIMGIQPLMAAIRA
jgi:hypothetical protein